MTNSKFWNRFGKIILAIVILLLALILFFLLGTIIGYSVIGGGAVSDIFTSEFWQTLFGFFGA